MSIIRWKQVIIFLSLCVISSSCTRNPASVKVTKTGDDIRKELKQEKNKEANQNNPSSGTSVAEKDSKGVSLTPQKQTGKEKELSTDPKPPAVVVVPENTSPVVDTSFPVVTAPEDTPPVAIVEDQRVLDSYLFNFCTFPESLKAAVLQELNEILDPAGRDCSFVNSMHLALIKKLAIRNVTSEQKILLDREHEIYSSTPEEIDKEYGAYFSALEELDISNNPQMLSLPNFISFIPNLVKLNISNTGIQNLSGDICNLKKLTTVITSQNSSEEQEETSMAVFCLNP